jgi:superoxide dismutase, Cu-Zn family
MRQFLTICILPLVAGCSTMASTQNASTQNNIAFETLSADLIGADGVSVGVATLTKRTDGIILNVNALASTAGTFGMHLHSVGKCEGPDFASAGGHWNPDVKQHGRDNPMGAHGGDLPNAVAGVDKKVILEFRMPEILLKGDGGLLDADGAALVIHEKPDDYKTDPTGNSGKRKICGVFKG